MDQGELSAPSFAADGKSLMLLIENSPLAVVGADVEGRVTIWNPAAERMFGWTRAEALGHINPTVPDELRDEFAALRGRALEGAFSGVETQRKRRDGSTLEVRIWAFPLRHEKGRVIGAAALVQDITEQKQNEARRRESEERFGRVYDSNMLPIFFWEASGEIVDANDAFLSVIGYERSDLERGSLTWPGITPEQFHELDLVALEEIRRSGESSQFEKEFVRKDGSRVPVIVGGASVGDRERGVGFVLDISERREAEQTLTRRFEQQELVAELARLALEGRELAALFDVAASSICRGTQCGRCAVYELDSNRGGLIDHGTCRSEAAEANLIAVDLPKITELIRSRDRLVLDRDDPQAEPWMDPLFPSTELRCGIAVPVRVGFQPWGLVAAFNRDRRKVHDDDFRFLEAVANLLAIGVERKEAEQRLLESEARLSMLTEQLPAILWSVDRDLVITSSVGQGLERFELGPNELRGKRLQDVQEPDAPLMRAAIRAMEGSTIRIDTKGAGRNFETVLTPLRDAAGEIAGVVALGLDVTEQRRVENALRESEARFRNVADSAPVGIWMTDTAGNGIFANRQFVEMSGLPRKRILGDGWVEVVHEQDRERVVELYRSARRDCRPVRIEFRLSQSDGAERWVISSGVPRIDPDGSFAGFIGSLVEVTEERQAHERMRQSRQRLRELSSRVLELQEQERKMIAREIHDRLGQVLSALKFETSWLRSRVGADLQEKVDSMSRTLDETIQEVREFSAQLRPKVLDDFGLVPAVEDLLSQMQERTGLECDLSIRPEDLELDGPRSTTVFRILQEALTNVARHAEATRVEVRLRRRPDLFWVEIRDDGRGIRDEEVQESGSLGILGMRERAQQWDGSLHITGIDGRGTIVVVEMPLAPETAAGDDELSSARKLL